MMITSIHTSSAHVIVLTRSLGHYGSDLEISGRLSTHGVDDYFDPLAQRLAALKIESIHAVQAKAGREGTVSVQPGGGRPAVKLPSLGHVQYG